MAREIEVNENTIDETTDNSTEVSIEIDGTPYRYWVTADINLSFDTIADTFTLTGPYQVDDLTIRSLFKPFTYKEIVLYIGGYKVLTGTIVKPKNNVTNNSRTIMLSGYSKPGVLAHSSVSPNSWPVELNGLDLLEIAEKLAQPFGIKVVFEDDPGPKFEKGDKVAIAPDQKIYDFLIPLAQERGFVMSSDVDGNLLFQRTTIQPATIKISEGQFPFISADIEFDGEKRYSDVTAISTEIKSGPGQIYSVTDPELKRNGIFRPMAFKASNTNKGNLVNAATAQLGRNLSNSIPLNVGLTGWYPPGESEIWKDNTKIFFTSPGCQIFSDTEFLIRSVALQKKPKSITSSLSLVFPEAYNNEIRSVYPWD